MPTHIENPYNSPGSVVQDTQKGFVKQTFIPYVQAIIPNDGENLVVHFIVRNIEADDISDIQCNSRIVIPCTDNPIDSPQDFLLLWTIENGTETKAGLNTNVVAGYTFDIDVPATELVVTIIKANISARNRFKLFVVLDDESILLSRGVIFTNV